MSGRSFGRFTVGRLMLAIAALAVLLAAGMYRQQNLDVDRATISANLWALRRGDPAARRGAAFDLNRIKPTDSAPVEAALAEAVVGDGDAQVRVAAAGTLGWVVARAGPGQPAGAVGWSDADLLPTRALLRAMADPEPAVRTAAVQAMPQVQTVGRVTPELTAAIEARYFRLLDDPNPTIRAAAIHGLGWTKPAAPAARDRALILLKTDPEVTVRRAGIDALVWGWPAPELYPTLLAWRDSAPTEADRSWILKSLLGSDIIPPPESIPPLVGLLDTDPTAAAWLPGRLARLGRAATPYLGALARVAARELGDGPTTGLNAVFALTRIDPASPEAQAILVPISERLRDATANTDRSQFVWLLDRYGQLGAPAAPTLRAALHSPLAGVRGDAARLLGSLGPAATLARLDLEALAQQDPDSTVRTLAQQALAKLHQE